MMSGIAEPAGLSATVELKGHLIDSLTLSKVVDRVQQLGGDYQLNDIHVGSLKKDISSINMTLYAQDQITLDRLLEALAPYGAVANSDQEASRTVVCEQDGQPPAMAFGVKLPRRVHTAQGWQTVENGGPWVLSLENGVPKVKPACALKAGDTVLSGTSGLQW